MSSDARPGLHPRAALVVQSTLKERSIMSHERRPRAAGACALALAACLALLGCGHDQPLQPTPLSGLAPDFSLSDVNPNSASTGKLISPRAEMGSVSAWYFGHAT
jgi:hypothetical protein